MRATPLTAGKVLARALLLAKPNIPPLVPVHDHW
jgi:hypothetical protein